MITTFHLSGPDLVATNNELYWQTLAERNYSTGTMVNQLIRVFLKFNFMALQHQAKWSLMLLWVNELYPLCLQLLNTLVKTIKCYTYNLSQGPSFAMGCNSPWSAQNASALTGLKPGLAAPFSGCWAPPHLGPIKPTSSSMPCMAPASLSCGVGRREGNQSFGHFTSVLITSKTRHCSPALGWGTSADNALGWGSDGSSVFRSISHDAQTPLTSAPPFQYRSIDRWAAL